MALQGGGNELAGNVAFIDGELYPLRSFECSVENNFEEVGFASQMKSQKVISGTEISGSMETYRKVELPAHLGAPEMHRVYLFTQEDGTKERVILDGVFFEPKLPSNNKKTQTIEFIATEIQYD